MKNDRGICDHVYIRNSNVKCAFVKMKRIDMYNVTHKCLILDANYSEKLLLSLMVDHIIIEI